MKEQQHKIDELQYQQQKQQRHAQFQQKEIIKLQEQQKKQQQHLEKTKVSFSKKSMGELTESSSQRKRVGFTEQQESRSSRLEEVFSPLKEVFSRSSEFRRPTNHVIVQMVPEVAPTLESSDSKVGKLTPYNSQATARFDSQKEFIRGRSNHLKQMITSELAMSKRDVLPNHGFFDDDPVEKSKSPEVVIELTQKSAFRLQQPVQEYNEEKTQTLLSHS